MPKIIGIDLGIPHQNKHFGLTLIAWPEGNDACLVTGQATNINKFEF